MMKKIKFNLVVALYICKLVTGINLYAQTSATKIYVTGTVNSNERMRVSVSGAKTIEGQVVTAEINGKKTEARTDKKGQALLDFSSIGENLAEPSVATIKLYDKKGNLLDKAKSNVVPVKYTSSGKPLLEKLPANMGNGEPITIPGRNLGADARLVIDDQVQQTLSASDREMTVLVTTKPGEHKVYIKTNHGAGEKQNVNIYSLSFELAKTSLKPGEQVQAQVQYESIPAGTKLVFTNRSPQTVKMGIPGTANLANECIYEVSARNGQFPVNLTGINKGDFSIALDFDFSDKTNNKENLSETKQLLSKDEEIDYDKIKTRDQLPKLIIPGYDKYSAERLLNPKMTHEEAMKKAFPGEDAQKRWSDVFKRIYGK